MWPTKCGECGEDLATDERLPCPRCGGTIRHFFVSAYETINVTTSVSVSMRYIRDRPWSEKWWAILRHLAQIENAYGAVTHPPDTDAMKDLVHQFCAEVYGLKDWLAADRIAPQAEINDWVGGSDATSIDAAGGVTNAWKHKRTWPDKTRAHVASIDLSPGAGVRITIEVERDGATRDCDALDLARAAVAQWQTFFANHGLAEP